MLNDPTIMKLRGGDLGPIDGDILAKTFGVLAAGDALAGTVQPAKAWEMFGVTIEPGSKGEHYLGHGMASSATSLAVTSLLALTGKASVNEAIGYGILARCAYLTEALLTGKHKELGIPTMPHVVMYLVLLGTAFGLLSGNADYENAGKVVSLLLAGHGALLFLNPRIDDDDKTKQMARFDGGYMFISSFYSALLAFGVEPVAAMGYAAVACVPLFFSLLDLFEVDELFGLSPGSWMAALAVFCGVSAFGMLA
jgi:hypothetical protein